MWLYLDSGLLKRWLSQNEALREWTLIQHRWCTYKKKKCEDRKRHQEYVHREKTMQGHSQKVAFCKSRRQCSEETRPWEFPVGPVAETLQPQCRGCWVRELDPTCHNYRFCMLQWRLKILCVTTKSWCSQKGRKEDVILNIWPPQLLAD